MSINQRYGINPEKTVKKGKIFHTIDYELNDDFSVSDFKARSSVIPAGTFFIDGKSYNVTLHEMERILESSENALKSLYNKYRVGMMNR